MNIENTGSTGEMIATVYNECLQEIKKRAMLLETPADVAKKEAEERIFKLTEEILSLGILSDLVTADYQSYIDKVNDKKEEIRRFYDIDAEKDSLTAINAAHDAVKEEYTVLMKELSEKFTESQAERKAEFEKLIEQNSMETAESIRLLDAEIKELKENYKLNSERDKSEYEYNLKRNRRLEKEEHQKQLEKRNAELDSLKKEAADKKQECVAEIEAMDILCQKVADINKLTSEARARGAEAKETELKREYGYSSELKQKDHSYQIEELKLELERLKRKYNEAAKEKNELSAKLDKCNTESRQLTSDTVRSIGGINILSSEAAQGKR